MEKGRKAKHVVMVPSTGMGHYLPFMELAKQLMTSIQGLSITFITNSLTPQQAQDTLTAMQKSGLPLSLIPLPHPCNEDGNPMRPSHVNFLKFLFDFMERSVPAFESTLKSVIKNKSVPKNHNQDGQGPVESVTETYSNMKIESVPITHNEDANISVVKNHNKDGMLFVSKSVNDDAKMSVTKGKSVANSYNEIKTVLDKDDVIVVTDLFCSAMIEPAKRLGLKTYTLFTATAGTFYLLLYHSVMDSNPSLMLHGKAPTDMVDVPHLGKIPVSAFADSVKHPESDEYKVFLQHSRRLAKADVAMLNSFEEFEVTAFRALRTATEFTVPPVLPVGPMISMDRDKAVKHECLTWLDGHPAGSVVYVSFGSVNCLSEEQVSELAEGLERSGQRFLWVARAEASVLPEGFEERVRGHGLVIKSWAPQVAILAHESVGGFVCHGGINSMLESVWFGVPMIGWPLGADQTTTAYFACHEARVGLHVVKRADGIVGREEVEGKVRELMECEAGKKVRASVLRLMESARKAPRETLQALDKLFS